MTSMRERFDRLAVALRELAASPVGRALLAVTAAFYVLTALVPSAYLIAGAALFAAAFSIIVAVVWFPYALYAARDTSGNGSAYLIIAVFLIAVGSAPTFVFSVIFRNAGMPQEWLMWPWLGYFRILAGIGFSMAITAPGMRDGVALPSNRLLVVLGWILAGALLGAAITAAVWSGRPFDATNFALLRLS